MPACHVPEQSASLMEAFSEGHSFSIDSHLFLSGQDWLMAIGYPAEGKASPERFTAALELAMRQCRPTDCFAIAPTIPESLRHALIEEDIYYTLPADAPVPKRLHNSILRAQQHLVVDESRVFTAAHRRLWSEFMTRVPLPPRVRQLYALTEQALRKAPQVRLLNAWDKQGNLSAALLLDYSQPASVSYIIGAHSRTYYIPHAHDVLFATMLVRAREEHKEDILLGLGVNEGISRFKKKWGGTPQQAFQMAVWTNQHAATRLAVSTWANEFLNVPSDLSKRQIFALLPEQRPFAMLWRLDKNGRASWIGGAAHFFCYSFEHSLRRLFQNVDTVLFEGPIDQDSLQEVERHGRTPEPDSPRVAHFLAEAELCSLERTVRGSTGLFAQLLNHATKNPADVRDIVANTRPWYAFFSLWTAFLGRHEWKQSVDMEAWHTALDMGKQVIGMESLAEQIASLESAPLPRIIRFLKAHNNWKKRMQRNRAAYLAGNLKAMMGTSAEFPTRTETIIDMRDQRFRERMRPFIERGGTAVFVGTAHMQNLRPMLAEDGFTVTRELPTLHHRIKAYLSRDATVIMAGNPHAPATFSSPIKQSSPQQHSQASAPLRSAPSSGRRLQGLTAQALVPEQLIPYVQAVSQGTLRACGDFAAWVTTGSTVLVAYPTDGNSTAPQAPDYATRVHEAAMNAINISESTLLTILSPVIPEAFSERGSILHDTWWVMDLPFSPGQKLRNMIRRAHHDIDITQEQWTSDHAALVEWYLKHRQLAAGTRHIFSKLEHYLKSSPAAMLFSARDKKNNLAGFAIGDFSALSMAFYMFAFRKPSCPPGTSDALLAALAEEATQRGFSRLNLGLGIDDGISFFKRKWDAYPLFSHYELTFQK